MKNLYKFPSLCIWISILIITAALLWLKKINISLYPDTNQPVVTSGVRPKGTDPRAFKKEYGKTIENSLKNITDVEKVTGDYSNESARWDVTFPWGYESKKALTEVEKSISATSARFPREWGGVHSHINSNSSVHLYMSINTKTADREKIIDILENSIRPQIEAIDGINFVFIANPKTKWLVIKLQPKKMTELAIFPQMIKNSLKKVLYNKNIGTLKTRTGDYKLVAPLMADNLEELKKTVVKRYQGINITLEDVATVEIKEETSTFIFHDNGTRAFILGVEIKPSANINKVSDEVLSTIEKNIYKTHPQAQISMLLDPAKDIKQSIQSMWWAIVTALISAAIVILLFLRSLAATAIIALSIPLSLAGGILLMHLTGIQINLLSLSAMALAVGMVVDGAIVIIDNISRHIKTQTQTKDPRKIVQESVKEVRQAIITSTLTTILVFTPLLFTQPLVNALLGDLAIVMATILLASLFVTLVIIPPLFVLVLKRKARKEKVQTSPSIVTKKKTGLYVKILNLILNKKAVFRTIVAGLIAAFGLSLYVIKEKIPKEIIGKPLSDKIIILIKYKQTKTVPEDSEKIVNQYEQQLKQDIFKKHIHSHLSFINLSQSQILCVLKDPEANKTVKKLLEDKLTTLEGTQIHVFSFTPSSLDIPEPALVEGKIIKATENKEQKRKFMDDFDKLSKESKHISRSKTSPDHKQQELFLLSPKDYVTQSLGTQYDEMLNLVWDVVEQAAETTYLDAVNFSEKKYAVKVLLAENKINTIEDILNLNISWQDNFIPIKNIIHAQKSASWDNIYTEQGSKQYTFAAYLKESHLDKKDKLRTEFTEQTNKLAEKHGLKLSFDNPEQNIQDNLRSLFAALMLAFVILLILLSYQFGPGFYPLLILLPIPLGIIGTAFSLYTFKSTLSLNSMMGMILLAGTAVNNSIIFVDFFLQRRKNNKQEPLLTAVTECARLRIRPIIMTTLTTLVGMLPLALALSTGSEIVQPLGITVCGGLFVSTILTIFVVPMLLYWKNHKSTPQKSASTIALVLISLVLLASSTENLLAKSNTLSLEEASKRAVDTNLNLQQSSILAKKENNKKAQKNYELLPKIDLYSNYTKTKNFFDKPGEDYSAFNNSVKLSQNIPDPWSWSEQTQELEANSQKITEQINNQQIKIITDTKNLYFTVLVKKEAFLLAKKNLELANKIFIASSKRFKRGFISNFDLLRAQINLKSQELQFKQQQEEHTISLTNLLSFINLEKQANLTLKTLLPDDKKILSLLKNLKSKVSFTTSLKRNLLIKEKNIILAKLKAQRASLRPKLNLSLEQNLKNETSAAIGISWNIFNQKQDSYAKKNLALDLEAKNLEMIGDNKETTKRNSIILTTLANLTNKLTTQVSLNESYQKISTHTQKRYQQGLISATVFYDDLKQAISAQEKLLGIRHEIISSIISWQKESGQVVL